jgi:hypothetical protein
MKRNFKKSILIRSHIVRILPTSNLHGLLVWHRNSELPPSLKSLWNSIWLQYSKFPGILFRLGSNPAVERLLHSAKTRIPGSHRQPSTILISDSFVGLRHMGSHWKAEKVLHDLAIRLSVRFLLHWYHICIFWLLCAVKLDLMSVPKFHFDILLSIQRWPPSTMYQQLHAFYLDCYS